MQYVEWSPVTHKVLRYDLSILKRSLSEFIAVSDSVFGKQADTISWNITSGHGRTSDKARINVQNADDIVEGIFSKIGDDAELIGFQIYPAITERLGANEFELLPEESVSLEVFPRLMTVTYKASVVTRKQMQLSYQILMQGIEIMPVDLPKQHQYLSSFLEKFFNTNPYFDQNVFLAMRFREEKPFEEIARLVKETCSRRSFNVVRADDRLYADDLWDNILTYIYGCKYGIVVFDEINDRRHNPNVSIELGFMMAQCKRVLLLKDRAIEAMPTDVMGKIYRPFNS